jgi:hypothetical protein
MLKTTYRYLCVAKSRSDEDNRCETVKAKTLLPSPRPLPYPARIREPLREQLRTEYRGTKQKAEEQQNRVSCALFTRLRYHLARKWRLARRPNAKRRSSCGFEPCARTPIELSALRTRGIAFLLLAISSPIVDKPSGAVRSSRGRERPHDSVGRLKAPKKRGRRWRCLTRTASTFRRCARA